MHVFHMATTIHPQKPVSALLAARPIPPLPRHVHVYLAHPPPRTRVARPLALLWVVLQWRRGREVHLPRTVLVLVYCLASILA